MIHSTQSYLPWSSISLDEEEDLSTYDSTVALTPPDTPLEYKQPFYISDPCEKDQPYYYQQQQQLLQNIPPTISICLNDYGLRLDTNFTDIARLRNYLLSFVMEPTSPSSSTTTSSTSSGQLVPRNKRYRNKPVNLFQRFYELGQLYINGGGSESIPMFFQQMLLRQQTVFACIHTYFDCWVRYFPVFPRQQILAIMDQPRGLDSVIVNAIACFALKHMFAHHQYPPALEGMRRDPTKIRDMEEFFFNAAKHTLEQVLFDDDDNAITRFDIMGIILMSYRVDRKKKAIYMSMAVQALQSLQIRPGDDDDDNKDDIWKAELDTRLWWMAWMNDFAVSSSGSSTTMPFYLQDDNESSRRIRVPRLWSFDCDGASEYGILVNEHCLSIWRMQADIVQHHYTSTSDDNTAVDYDLLATFDSQLDQFLQHLPSNLQSNVPYDASAISLVRARVHLEFNATRIILHKLYIPDDDNYLMDATHFLQWRSLNICLQAALDQLTIFHHCIMDYPLVLRCGFDRDELWRAAEIISVALDFLDRIQDNSSIRQRILYQVGTKDTLLQALQSSLTLVQHTYELRECNNSNFRQLEEWLMERIQYHNKTKHHRKPCMKKRKSSGQQISFSTNVLQHNSDIKHRTPPKTRFRYFSPKQSNGLLFIDENPMHR
ncbi:uncharacterized protein BX664DRAFT_342481 [Halteromyces radiatus]|uniref:uncharacterized protein n=1 Tax=Halteromyces radiatus TaxID=101107 RepID=UPI0022206866|nr:uncharacterized protein BX664DRAFT_342481 [Halteromyces radiatus]KAI8078684.1 hypothetical protein BX664DRAFT_342481 [Halteromyces radiatus]